MVKTKKKAKKNFCEICFRTVIAHENELSLCGECFSELEAMRILADRSYSGKPYDPQVISYIAVLLEKRFTLAKIGRMFGRTKQAVAQLVFRHKISQQG